MSTSTRKLVGTIGTLAWIVVYAFIVTGIAVRVLPHANALVAFLFYALAGTLWIVPVGLALPWMYRQPGKR